MYIYHINHTSIQSYSERAGIICLVYLFYSPSVCLHINWSPNAFGMYYYYFCISAALHLSYLWNGTTFSNMIHLTYLGTIYKEGRTHIYDKDSDDIWQEQSITTGNWSLSTSSARFVTSIHTKHGSCNSLICDTFVIRNITSVYMPLKGMSTRPTTYWPANSHLVFYLQGKHCYNVHIAKLVFNRYGFEIYMDVSFISSNNYHVYTKHITEITSYFESDTCALMVRGRKELASEAEVTFREEKRDYAREERMTAEDGKDNNVTRNGFHYIYYTDKDILNSNESKTTLFSWEEAEAYCQSHVPAGMSGGHLLSIHSQEDLDALLDKFPPEYTTGLGIFIGMKQVGKKIFIICLW